MNLSAHDVFMKLHDGCRKWGRNS